MEETPFLVHIRSSMNQRWSRIPSHVFPKETRTVASSVATVETVKDKTQQIINNQETRNSLLSTLYEKKNPRSLLDFSATAGRNSNSFMAHQYLFPPLLSFSSRHVDPAIRSFDTAGTQHSEVPRRSANYQPSIWDNDFLQSLNSDYLGEIYVRKIERLKDDVKRRFDEAMKPVSLLELINTLQRLGVGYHFENEIKRALDTILPINKNNGLEEEDLYATALHFRLLRQYGYEVSQGEELLDEAQEFTTRHLKELKGNIAPHLVKQVSHALELPLHWTLPRIEARWFIDFYKMKEDMDPLLLEFAKWWKSLDLGKTLSFARDRLVECFLWAKGLCFEPQFGNCRKQITKTTLFITTIDDIYDVYGSLDELKLFTDAVEKLVKIALWDVNTLQDLPEYMKICFIALYNTSNEMACEILKEKGWDIIPYIKKAWADLCKAYLVEAMWYYTGYRPSLEEYMNNAWISIMGNVIHVHAYFFLGIKITKEALECLMDYPNLVRWSNLVVRFADDLGTSTDELERGDVPKSIQCYMHDSGVSEETACEHIKHLIRNIMKKMNKDRVASSPFPQPFISAAVNATRTAQFMYQYGDGHGVPDQETKERVFSLLVKPISLMKG
ncbi:hypothetical protein HHK36_030521 [Tetracentron sinense]|uniref:Uncharacterized protein n=1 Tax=Tetracentron sinense TaxID=13715 RepID=A0A834Y9I1_TETSI|nr:hypothetical protein HHK36_030521 [Tetracentron sinense]